MVTQTGVTDTVDTAVLVDASEASAAPAARSREFGSSARLWGGFFGRAWLWFVGGCLVVTFLPMLFGWRPYVVESGSMTPRIKVGDVILSSPEHDPAKLLGHVAVFNDPDASHAGTVKSHRVVSINKDGTLMTKGDANPTSDPVPLKMSEVRGIGRLLVRWAGLPLIWLQRGQWLQLALLVGSLWMSAVLVVRDREEPIDDGTDDSADDDSADDDSMDEYDSDDGETSERDADEPDPPERRVPDRSLPGVHRRHATTPTAQLFSASRASGLRRVRTVGAARHRRRTRTAQVTHWATVRIAAIGLGAAALLVPTTQAAMSATTIDTSNTWSAGSFDYATEVNALGPWLYWRLDDSGKTAADASGNNRTGSYNSNWTRQQVGALVDQTPNYAAQGTDASGASVSCIYTSLPKKGTSPGEVAAPGPAVYSEVIWFKSAAGYASGGKLIGLESAASGVSDANNGGVYDRMLYMDGNGEIWFGVWSTAANAAVAIHSASGLNDGNWHLAVATMSASAGMALYIDGQPVATVANTVSETESGPTYWRVGCGNLAGWGGDWTGPNAPDAVTQTNYPFTGMLDEATVFTTALTAKNVADLYFYH
jgi:signal peptidase I